jgi:hypothetical protein
MIRFIFKNQYKLANGFESQDYHTLDLKVPELEAKLREGGFGEDGWDTNTLVGVEIIKESNNGTN